LCFDELVRRGNLEAVAGPALKVYTVDKHGFYGKVIRCEAMKEMATRTSAVPSEIPKAPSRYGGFRGLSPGNSSNSTGPEGGP
jgi:hypothetical protein